MSAGPKRDTCRHSPPILSVVNAPPAFAPPQLPAEIGAGCELLWLGLCRYPAHVPPRGPRLLTQCARTAGLHVRINDEGGYWPHRDLAALRENLVNMNGIVAAFGGALKDATENAGDASVQSPIFPTPIRTP